MENSVNDLGKSGNNSAICEAQKEELRRANIAMIPGHNSALNAIRLPPITVPESTNRVKEHKKGQSRLAQGQLAPLKGQGPNDQGYLTSINGKGQLAAPRGQGQLAPMRSRGQPMTIKDQSQLAASKPQLSEKAVDPSDLTRKLLQLKLDKIKESNYILLQRATAHKAQSEKKHP